MWMWLEVVAASWDREGAGTRVWSDTEDWRLLDGVLEVGCTHELPVVAEVGVIEVAHVDIVEPHRLEHRRQ